MTLYFKKKNESLKENEQNFTGARENSKTSPQQSLEDEVKERKTFAKKIWAHAFIQKQVGQM